MVGGERPLLFQLTQLSGRRLFENICVLGAEQRLSNLRYHEFYTPSLTSTLGRLLTNWSALSDIYSRMTASRHA